MTTYATDIYSGDGSQVDFGVTFPFIQRSHVKVFRIENSDGSRTELTLTTSAPAGDEYQWQSDVLIRVGTAPTNVQKLSIERDTPEDQQLVQWADGSYIIAEDLNTSDKQWLYGLQELEDKFDLLTAEAIKYRGTIDLTVDAAPANPQNGDYFINSGSGTVVASWTGIAGDNVQGSEQVIYNSLLGEWQILETPASQKGVLEVTGTAPIQVDNTDAQRPVVSVSAATTTDAGVITDAASDNVLYGRENGGWVAVANTAVSANPPASPSNGDGWYDLNTGRLYLWINDGDSSQWAEANPGLAGGGGASVEVGDTPPASPSDGDLWWDSSDDSGRLYIYYEDGNTNQWVEASPPATDAIFWERTNATLSPATAGDDVDLGTGLLRAANGRLTEDLRVGNISTGVALGARGTSSGQTVSQFISNDTTTTALAVWERSDGAVSSRLQYDGGGFIELGTTTGHDFRLQTNDIARVNIDGTTGNVGIGGTLPATPNITLSADGRGQFGLNSGSVSQGTNGINLIGAEGRITVFKNTATGTANDYILFARQPSVTDFRVTATGSIQATDTTVRAITSERRLKENITPIDSGKAWETIKSVPYYAYNYKDLPADAVMYGPMADEVPDEMRIATDRTDDVGVIHTYDNGMLQARLYTALQTALTRIEALEAEVQSLKGGI